MAKSIKQKQANFYMNFFEKYMYIHHMYLHVLLQHIIKLFTQIGRQNFI